MEYVTLQDIGKARWRAKRTLPGCPGDRTLRSERRCHHTGAEEAAIRAHSPSDISARRQVQDSGKKKKGTNLTRRWSEPFRHRQRKVVGTNRSTAHQWKRVQHPSILRIPTKGRPLLRNKTSMTCENTHRDGYVGRLKGFFLCKKKEIKDGLKGRLIWSMDYIYTKPNKQIVIDILMSLYSSFYPAEYAKDVTGAATSAIGLDIDNHVPAISHQIGTRKPAKMVLKMG